MTFLQELRNIYENIYTEKTMKPFTTPKLYHGGKSYDLKKRWYIYFNYINPETGLMTRQTPISFSLNFKHKDVPSRLKHFNILLNIIDDMLKKGYSPYDKSLKEEIFDTENSLNFALELKSKQIGKNTFKDYRSKINIFKNWLDKQNLLKGSIKNITKKDVNQFLNFILMSGNSNATNRNNYRSVLSSIFSLLEKNDYIEKNFVREISTLYSRPERNKTYDIDKAQDLILHIEKKAPTLGLLIKFISYNMLRPIEVCRLQVKDIELNSNPPILRVRAKNKVAKTKIIPEVMLEELRQLDLTNPESYLITYKGVAETNTYEGDRSLYFSKKFREIKNEFGLGVNYGLYSFRHTYITKLYRELRKTNGQFETYDKLMLITGHSTLDSLKKYLRDIDAELPDDYSHLLK